MQVGRVKWYDCRKGYGFIITAGGDDVLAHYSVIEGTGFRRLWDGEEVEYEAVRRPQGLNATFVRRLNPERPAAGKQAAAKQRDAAPVNPGDPPAPKPPTAP